MQPTGKQEKRKTGIGNKWKRSSKIVYLSPSIFIITQLVSSLHQITDKNWQNG